MASRPKGKAVYARGDLRGRCRAYAQALKLDWLAIWPSMVATDGPHQTGKPTWLYTTPGGTGGNFSWAVSRYKETIRQFEPICLANGLRGYLADIEPNRDSINWRNVSDEQVAELAAELLASKRRTGLSVGVTMFYAQTLWRRLGPLIGRDIWINLQMYDTGRTKERNSAILGELKAAGWSMPDVIAVATYRHLTGQADIDAGPGEDVVKLTGAEFAAYTAKLPSTRGAILWYPTPAPAPDSDLGHAIARWKPTPWWVFAGPFLGVLAVGALGLGAWAYGPRLVSRGRRLLK